MLRTFHYLKFYIINSRNTFCKSKFREDFTTINGISYQLNDKKSNVLLKIIDGSETEIRSVSDVKLGFRILSFRIRMI